MTNETSTEERESALETDGQKSAGAVSQDDRSMGMLCHLLGFFGLLGPLLIWLIKKDQSAFVDQQGKESLNFHISVAIIAIPVSIIAAILSMIPFIGLILSIPLYLGLMALGIYTLIQIVMASVKTNNGIAYRYPYRFELIK
jgi:uncharacterized Tic20 family protein